jgi:hypothetical protein
MLQLCNKLLAKHDYGDRNLAIDWTSQLLILSSFVCGLGGMTTLVWCGLVFTGLYRYAHCLIIVILYINTRYMSLKQSYVGSRELEQKETPIRFISTNLDFMLLLAKYNNLGVITSNIC